MTAMPRHRAPDLHDAAPPGGPARPTLILTLAAWWGSALIGFLHAHR